MLVTYDFILQRKILGKAKPLILLYEKLLALGLTVDARRAPHTQSQYVHISNKTGTLNYKIRISDHPPTYTEDLDLNISVDQVHLLDLDVIKKRFGFGTYTNYNKVRKLKR